jgi:hypothetical protein
MVAVHIVGLVILGVGLGLFAADQLIGRGRGEFGGKLFNLQISGPPALGLAVIGVLVFLFPFSPWWPAADSGPAPLPTASGVDLPIPDLIYNQPLDEAVKRLTNAGFVVREADIGCSNSTEPEFVRQVTLGPRKNSQIIYGKVTDDIDEGAVESLSVGDVLTVWAPSVNPCP